MFRIRKIWWAVTLFLILFYIPSKGHAVVISNEYYERTILTGRMTFQYDQSKSRSRGGGGTKSSGFNQNYTLSLSGKFLNRLLVIYNTGIGYNKRDRENPTSTIETDRLSYYLRVHFLPESDIPLILYGKRTISGDSTIDNYSLSWRGEFRRMPKTSLNIGRSNGKDDLTEWQSTNYRLNLYKKKEKSTNIFYYNLSKSEDITDSKKSSTMAMNFSNQTRISRNTSVGFNTTKGESKGTGTTKSSAEGIGVSLRSAPSNKFTHSHSYSYSKNKSASSQIETEGYGGNMSYRLSDQLASSISLSVANTDNDSLTSKREIDSLNTFWRLSYQASKKLSLSESIAYTTTTTSGSEAGQTNLIDLNSLRVTTRARYRTKLSWASMSTGYGIGYREESRAGGDAADPEERGASIDQNFSLTFGGIDAMGYAGMSASSVYGYSEEIDGDIGRSNFSLNVNARNKVWLKYVKLTATYRKKINKSWISAEVREQDRFVIKGNTAYLERYLNPRGNGGTKLSFTSSMGSTSSNFDEKTTSISNSATMNHDRIFARGKLSGLISYNSNLSESSGNKRKDSLLKLSAKYKRPLLRRILWSASASTTMKTINSNRSLSSGIANSFTYALRHWSLKATHSYSISHTNSKRTRSRITLTASRGFGRVL
jgi:hypothetical protein